MKSIFNKEGCNNENTNIGISHSAVKMTDTCFQLKNFKSSDVQLSAVHKKMVGRPFKGPTIDY